MDEEQSTRKWTKTKYALGAVAGAVAITIIPPLLWAGYVFGRTTDFAFRTTKTAFDRPWLTAGILAGGMIYHSHTQEIHDTIGEYATNAKQTIVEYRQDTLMERIEGLEKALSAQSYKLSRTGLEGHLANKSSANNYPNKDLYLGLGLGAGGALLGFGAYSFMRPRRRNPDVRVVR